VSGTLALAAIAAVVCASAVIEAWWYRRQLARIPVRVHVNGTRGKSSVTRLIAAGLRAGGIRTCAKTTGTLARMILSDGRELPIFRPDRANVIEQKRIVANAVADGTYQTGALNYKTYDSLVESDSKIAENTVKIWTTPFYADYNFTIHPDVEKAFGDGFIENVQTALISAPAGSDALKAINREAIIPAKNEDFDGIKDTAIQMGLIEEEG